MPAAARRAADAFRAQTTPGLTVSAGGHAARCLRPLLLLGALTLAFSVPQLVGGTVQFDGVDVHYSSQRYFSDAIHAGHLPFWTSYLFSGFPFLADLQVGAWYPLNWPFFLVGITPSSISGELALHTWIACGGAYALAMRLMGNAGAALAAGMLYGFSGFFAAHSQHVGIFQTAAWLPWLVLVLDAIAERLTIRRLALAGLVGAMLALPGHFQAALYAVSGAAVWGMLEASVTAPWARTRRVAVGVLATGVWGALLAAVMILPAFELVSQSVRTQLNARAIDLGYFQPEALLTLVQPDHYGLLSGAYTGPGDVTQHYFYAGLALAPLALLGGMSQPRVLRSALFLGVPFVWYALGPRGGLFRVVSRLPGFSTVELPMHGWFLPALGLALLGGAGLATLESRCRWRGLTSMVLLATFVDLLVTNQLLNPLAFSRQSFAQLYLAPQRALQAQLQTAQPAVQRLYGPPLAAVGYRNHPLQDHVETTYGYNPLELLSYADYADAAETNPRLRDGLAATHRLDNGTLEVNPTALPLAFFARHVTSVADPERARAALAELDPSKDTIVVGRLENVQLDVLGNVEVVDRGEGQLTLRYQSVSSNLVRVAVPDYPGWHATLDGTDLPMMTVDLAFIGVVVPPGQGVLQLAYAPRLFWPAAAISIIAVLGTIAALARRPARRGS